MPVPAMSEISLPAPDGTIRRVGLAEPREWPTHPGGYRTREVYAAAHVVADPLGDNTPGRPAAVDWDATLAFRRHLFEYGFGVAEAMDTAQRNMGLDWPATRELIRRSANQASALGGRIFSGVGTDHVGEMRTRDAVAAAYREQLEFVQGTGSRVILMASRQLAAVATGPDDYLTVYGSLLDDVDAPVILHWLGEVFDPQLRGYWGSTDIDAATATFLELIRSRSDKIDGVKVSLLSADHETSLRARLPDGVRLYTGDDFNYPELIRGDGRHHSDALLGAFAAIAPAASAALAALDDGDVDGFSRLIDPTVPLARHIFAAPTYYYKTGIAFMAWITGRQPAFAMIGGLQSARSLPHLAEIFTSANDAGLLPDPNLAASRMTSLLRTYGVSA